MNNNTKYVIAKTVGPKTIGSELGCLTIGKSYEVLYITYQVVDITGKTTWVKDKLNYNPEQPSFYIKIKEDDDGIEHTIWNDYFYSTKEVRELLIDDILA